jgi:hypothetical protein
MKTLRYAASARLLLALLVCGAAGLVSCSKKAEPPPPAPTPPPAPVEVKPAPQKEFTDPAQQADYEAEFQRLLDDCSPRPPPAPCRPFASWMRRSSAASLAKLNPTGIVLKLGKQELVASRTDLDPAFASRPVSGCICPELRHQRNSTRRQHQLGYGPHALCAEGCDWMRFTGPGPRFPRVEGLSDLQGRPAGRRSSGGDAGCR